jgi:transcriptional regulator with XRE-family HTH domain
MVHAMTDFPARLRALMSERGLGVRALAQQVPCDPALISRLASGKQQPSRGMAQRIDEVLKAGGELAAAAALPGPGSGLELVEMARRAGASDVSAGTLELLAEATDRLCRDYPVTDPGVLSARAREHLKYVTRLIAGRTTASQHRDLIVVAGWLSALMACTLYDAGDRAGAETARRMTRQFGSDAGHGELIAWSYEIAAWYALVDRRYRDSAAQSEAGLGHAGRSSAAVQLTVQAGRAYARMGDKRAISTLTDGRAILDRLPVPGHPEHHFVFDGDKHEFYAASILTWLGDDAAEEHARQVAAVCGEGGTVRWPMRLAYAQIDLALIAARRGDLDEAVGFGCQALSHQRRSADLLPRAAELGRELAGRYPGERLAAGYAEQVTAERRRLAITS